MINIRTILKLKDNEGITLRNGHIITYKTGWQVANYGIETTDPKTAIQMVKLMKGNCGIWYSEGIYYIDHSFRVNTKKEAIKIGIECNQISVYCWKTSSLTFCKEYIP